MHPSWQYVVLDAGEDREMLVAFARLPGARLVDRRRRRWMLPTVPRSADALRGLLGCLQATSEVLSWIGTVARWEAEVELWANRAAEPRLEFTTLRGECPEDLSWLSGEVTRSGGRVHVPFSVSNLRALMAVPTSVAELHLSAEVEKACGWLRNHPAATYVPGAQVSVYRGVAARQLSFEALWDSGVEELTAAHELRLMRERKRYGLADHTVTAENWPKELVATLVQHFQLGYEASAADLIESAVGHAEAARRLRDLSAGETSDLLVEGLGAELLPYQRAAVEYALERRRVILADEPGLGKTAEALATLEAAEAFPAVIVCPPHLTEYWWTETRRWLHARSVTVIPGSAKLPGGDLLIVADTTLGTVIDELVRTEWRGVVVDGAHRAPLGLGSAEGPAIRLVEALAQDAIRLALTGAPVSATLEQVAPLLRLIGRLHELPLTATARGREHQLRASCYVRRRRHDLVTQVPPMRRSVVPLPGVSREQLIEQCLDWIADFLRSGERLVVFCEEGPVRRAVHERFPEAMSATGAHSDAEAFAAGEAFGSPDAPQICVARVDAAHPRLRLEAAAHAAIPQLDAVRVREDLERCVGLSGPARATVAWYLVANPTDAGSARDRAGK